MTLRSFALQFAFVALATAPAFAFSGGAIRPTDLNGNPVANNSFLTRPEVFFTGGPELPATCSGSSLTDGLYYFQVTDLTGTQLLSLDASIDERLVSVSGGVIAQYLGLSHVALPNGPCGAIVVQLAPFGRSNDGDYKLWMTPVADYDAQGSGFFGFDPARSKTRTYHVTPFNPGPASVLRGHKFFDHDGDGVWNPSIDPLDAPIAGWRIEIFKNGQLDGFTFTDENGQYEFVRPRDGSTYTLREVAPGGFIGDQVPGAVWLATTPREFTVDASTAVVAVPSFGNVSFGVQKGVGRQPGFWAEPEGFALLEQCEPEWRDRLTSWNGSPLCLRRSISTANPLLSIFAPLALPTPLPTAFNDFRAWMLGSPNSGHAGYLLSREVAAAILSRRCGAMQFDAYIDRFDDGILVSFDDMLTQVQEMLLCAVGAGLTGPNDEYQLLRQAMLNCLNEFGSINNTADPASRQLVYGPDATPRFFSTPYLF